MRKCDTCEYVKETVHGVRCGKPSDFKCEFFDSFSLLDPVCFGCRWWNSSGRFCRLKTRYWDACVAWVSSDRCPEGKWPDVRERRRFKSPPSPCVGVFEKSGKIRRREVSVEVNSQPDRHPALYKKIFMRANGSQVDLVDLYHGQTAFICAGGTSFEKIDHRMFQRAGILTMALNNTGHLFRPTMWTGQDPQYRFMPSIWLDPKILKFTLFDYRWRNFWNVKEGRFSDQRICDCPSVIFHKRSSDFRPEEWINRDRIIWGTPKDLPEGGKGARSVLVAGLHILYFLGFKKVFLVGVDFDMDEKKKYWFDEDRTGSAVRNNRRVFEHVNRHLKDLQPHIQGVGFNVFNCNPSSNLEAFPYYPLNKALKEAEIDLSDSTKGMYVKRRG